MYHAAGKLDVAMHAAAGNTHPIPVLPAVHQAAHLNVIVEEVAVNDGLNHTTRPYCNTQEQKCGQLIQKLNVATHDMGSQ